MLLKTVYICRLANKNNDVDFIHFGVLLVHMREPLSNWLDDLFRRFTFWTKRAPVPDQSDQGEPLKFRKKATKEFVATKKDPELKIRLIPDSFHLQDVGKLDSGALYWIDVQLIPEGKQTRDFVVTYIFDLEGTLIQSDIQDLGLRSDPSRRNPSEVALQQKEKIGSGQLVEIWVHPFAVKSHDKVFGLVVRKPEPDEPQDIYEESGTFVDALPGCTLMFYPPWDEGNYDT